MNMMITKSRLLPALCLVVLALAGAAFAQGGAVNAVDSVNTGSRVGSAVDTVDTVDTVNTVNTVNAVDTVKAVNTAPTAPVAGDSAAAAPVTAAVTADSAAAVDTTTPSPRGRDLDELLAAEDAEDDLLAEDKPVVALPETADSAAVDSSDVQAAAPGSAQAEPTPAEGAAQADSALAGSAPAAAPRAAPGRRGEPPPRAAQAEPAEEGPAVIVDGRTINFAQNLREYRSPRVAMLLSLVVPGLGQAYSRNYVKAAAFGAVEVAGIVTAVALNSVGKSRKNDAHRFADERFETDRLRDYESWVRQSIGELELEELEFTPPYESYDEYFYEAAQKRSSYFYTVIGDSYFAPGWKDSDPHWRDRSVAADTIVGNEGLYVPFSPGVPELFFWIRMIADKAGNPVNGDRMLAFSSDQARYNSMIEDANSYHDAVNYTLYALIVNHIASAIDAGFTARAYNARLLGQESVWERLSVEQQYVFTGSEVSPGFALRLKF